MKLRYELEICDLHLKRAKEALKHINHLYPFGPNTFPLENYEDLASLDMFTGRLGKLQDAIGEKVIPAFLSASSEVIEGRSMIDMLNTLEKIGVLDDVSKWRRLREIRNTLSHEYPDSYEKISTTLNEAIDLFGYLEDVFSVIKSRFQDLNKSI